MTSKAFGSAVSPSSMRWRSAWRGLVLPGWLFSLLALLLLAFLILFGLLFVISTTYAGSEADSPARNLDRGWALLSALALLWAMVNLYWMTKAADLKNSFAVHGHFAMAIGCGLIALGIHSVMLASWIGSQPIVMDYSQSHGGQGPQQATAAAIEGDAEQGRKIFSTTCITCHGPTGGGMPNLAPSLRGSPFIASADDAAVAGVIRFGRAATDPNNKTKKVMPARGGNPFLGDDKIAHLVAFVRAIQTEAPASTAVDQDPDAAPPVQLAKWVLPAAPPPPLGMIRLESRDDVGDAASIASRDQQRRTGLVRTFVFGLTGVHFLFLVGVMIASSNLLVRDLLDDSPRENDSLQILSDTSDGDHTLLTWSSWGWVVATAVWFVVFLYGFVMT